MHVIQNRLLKRCHDGSDIREILLSGCPDGSFITHLRGFGVVTVIDSPETPFFTFKRTGRYSVKGMIGDRIIHAQFKKGDETAFIDDFSLILHDFQSASK
jgi:hypothetical protein